MSNAERRPRRAVPGPDLLLDGLERALQAILSPVERQPLEPWRAGVEESVGQLAGADEAHLRLRTPWGVGVASPAPLETTEPPSPTPNDRGHGARGLTLDLGPLAGAPATLDLAWTGPGAAARARRAAAALRAVLPALRAAALERWEHARRSAALSELLSALPGGALAFAEDGRLLHAAPALEARTPPGEEGTRLRGAMERLARRLLRDRRAALHPAGGTTPPTLDDELMLGAETFRLRATLLEPSGPGGAPVAIVRAELAPAPPTVERWGARFGLTPREAEVAACIAQGLTNREIAAELEVSTNTVQNHVRSLLAKLGVRSRAAVAARLEEA